MNTKILYLLAVVALALPACKQKPSDEPQPKQLELIGTWRSEISNGQELFTNDRTILSFISSSKFTMSLSRYIPEFDEFTWRNKAMGDYSFDGVHMVLSAADPGTHYIGRAYAIDDQSMKLCSDTFVNKKGLKVPIVSEVTYRRIDENLGYEDLILGTWEGVSHTGLETYGDHHHRWEYKPIDRSGFYTYVYYNYNDLTSQWEPAAQSSSEYNIHGSWLATRWQPQGEGLNYEWWDIDFITDTTMQWSALRYDAATTSSYRATFTFRRVIEK